MQTLAYLFNGAPPLDFMQECARAFVIFFYGLAVVRLLGRRVFGRYSAIDTIVAIVAGSNLSRTLTGPAPFWSTLAATTLLFALNWVLAHAAARWQGVSHLLEGKAIVIGERGRADEAVRRKMGVSEADLYEALRRYGVDQLEDTDRITMEPSGNVTVLKPRSK